MIEGSLNTATAVLYLTLCWVSLRAAATENPVLSTVIRFGPWVAVAMHGLLCFLSVDFLGQIEIPIQSIALVVTFFMTMIVLLINARMHNQALMLLVYLCAIVALLANIWSSEPDESSFLGVRAFVHVSISISAFSVLGLAALQTTIFTFLRRWLHSKQHLNVVAFLPPLDSVQSLNFRLLTAGWILLSLTIFSGVILYWGQLDEGIHRIHTFVASIAWILYAALFIGRKSFSWQARTTSTLSILAFLLLTVSYIGLKFSTFFN